MKITKTFLLALLLNLIGQSFAKAAAEAMPSNDDAKTYRISSISAHEEAAEASISLIRSLGVDPSLNVNETPITIPEEGHCIRLLEIESLTV